MSSKPRAYDSTIARIAGNIAGQAINVCTLTFQDQEEIRDRIAAGAVDIARRIVAEVQRTEPKEP